MTNEKTKLLNTPKSVRKVFSRHFLSAVHSEIGFAGTSVNTILAEENSLIAFFLSEGFETSKRFIQKAVMVKETEDTKPAIIMQNEIPLGFVFSSSKPRIDVQVLDTSIIISDFNYVGFETFNARFKRLCDGVSKFVPRKEVRKVGLRKIDSIAIEPVSSYQDAFEIFNPALFAIIRSGLLKEGTLKDHEEVTLIDKNSLRCIIRARLNQTSEKSCESTLDFDLLDMAPTSLDKVFTDKLPELNSNHYELFMWAASDELIKLLEGK